MDELEDFNRVFRCPHCGRDVTYCEPAPTCMKHGYCTRVLERAQSFAAKMMSRELAVTSDEFTCRICHRLHSVIRWTNTGKIWKPSALGFCSQCWIESIRDDLLTLILETTEGPGDG
jgi:hypothetical protein